MPIVIDKAPIKFTPKPAIALEQIAKYQNFRNEKNFKKFLRQFAEEEVFQMFGKTFYTFFGPEELSKLGLAHELKHPYVIHLKDFFLSLLDIKKSGDNEVLLFEIHHTAPWGGVGIPAEELPGHRIYFDNEDEEGTVSEDEKEVYDFEPAAQKLMLSGLETPYYLNYEQKKLYEAELIKKNEAKAREFFNILHYLRHGGIGELGEPVVVAD